MQKHFLRVAALLVLSQPGTAAAQAGPETPQVVIDSAHGYSVNGRAFTRYSLVVTNRAQYPAEMFAPAPNLPPCGLNARSSRSWVDIFRATGERIYGFCALTSPEGLGSIWFALPEGEMPPAGVRVIISDRATNRSYRSNVVALTPDALMTRAAALAPSNWQGAYSLADVAISLQFPANAPVDRAWYNRLRTIASRGGLN